MSKMMKKMLLGGLAVGGFAVACYASRRKDAISVVLKEQLTEGYLWMYSVETPDIIEEYCTDYVPSPAPVEGNQVYGQQTWKFVPKAPGTTMVTFSYLRPWEDTATPVVSGTYRFTVEETMQMKAELVELVGDFQDYVLSVG